MPKVIQEAKEKYTSIIIILYLPGFTSVSRPKTGYKRKNKQNNKIQHQQHNCKF